MSSDFYALRVLASYGMFVGKGAPEGKGLLTPNSISNLDESTYIYLWEKEWIWNTCDIMPQLEEMNLIYSNGGSVIFFKG